MTERPDVDRATSDDDLRAAVAAWVDEHVPRAWRDAAVDGHDAVRDVRPRSAYEAWYPTFAVSGLAVATWPVAYGGLDLTNAQARVIESVIAPLNLGRLNPLGLNNTASALFAYGSEEQRLRFLPPMVRNEERWCQMFSEPGAGSDLASLAMRAERDGDEWVLSGQKVWSTWAHRSEFAICLARTDPAQPKRKGITYFLVDLRSPGVEVRELRHMGGEVDFNEVWLDDVRVPDFHRVGAAGDGWRVAGATLSSERQMVAGSGSGGVDRLGGRGIEHLLVAGLDPVARDRVIRLYAEERIRAWTNERVRATLKAGGTPGPAASIGKVHQAVLNQALQLAATDRLGAAAMAWEGDVPHQVRGMIRSRANSIEGGTTEINKNVLGEQVLGLPREPDPWHGAPWEETPRS
ncbi:MAG: acyl-CoA dehydrogenase family protein [Acidimicrobiales bacterium]|nr:acyl-CoA dehydrogenase family protein [Acidimicrobiales bacterium]